jgi:hypothetical protein
MLRAVDTSWETLLATETKILRFRREHGRVSEQAAERACEVIERAGQVFEVLAKTRRGFTVRYDESEAAEYLHELEGYVHIDQYEGLEQLGRVRHVPGRNRRLG